MRKSCCLIAFSLLGNKVYSSSKYIDRGNVSNKQDNDSRKNVQNSLSVPFSALISRFENKEYSSIRNNHSKDKIQLVDDHGNIKEDENDIIIKKPPKLIKTSQSTERPIFEKENLIEENFSNSSEEIKSSNEEFLYNNVKVIKRRYPISNHIALFPTNA